MIFLVEDALIDELERVRRRLRHQGTLDPTDSLDSAQLLEKVRRSFLSDFVPWANLYTGRDPLSKRNFQRIRKNSCR